ncbi:hypothetical protein K7432_018631 [Basidiobolus ranarum]|uniref:ATP-dependent DNA helicase n=1 Tax=Basidiobolus ranarum TaxID=34480 RepID=A0ABR2VXI6_9FUNG
MEPKVLSLAPTHKHPEYKSEPYPLQTAFNAWEAMETHQWVPVVKFANGIECAIKQTYWTIETMSCVIAWRIGLPLILSFAITVHKSQGMTLDYVRISLQRAFSPGQAYVAISRARSLENLQLDMFNDWVIRAHPRVKEFYQKIQEPVIRSSMTIKRKWESTKSTPNAIDCGIFERGLSKTPDHFGDKGMPDQKEQRLHELPSEVPRKSLRYFNV